MKSATRPFLLFTLLALGSCRLTDHSEREGEVTTEDITFPVSGYENVDASEFPAITFESKDLDMGKVVAGARVEKRYIFRNTGAVPLVITDVRSTCGCTVGKDWPKDPVPPGAQGHIDVTFDSEGRTGVQNKTVTVVANTNPPSTVLTLSGEVVGPTISE